MTQPPNRQNSSGDERELMGRVAAALDERGLSSRVAALAIGVGVSTLERHLAGEHVRSDSAQKYRNWLEGRVAPRNVFVLPPRENQTVEDAADDDLPAPPARPRYVVD